MMYRSLHVIVFAFLLGGQCAAAAGAEPAVTAASFHSGLAQFTLRQAEIFCCTQP
jgi:hypothetical protein